jgi:hypothetical protein
MRAGYLTHNGNRAETDLVICYRRENPTIGGLRKKGKRVDSSN